MKKKLVLICGICGLFLLACKEADTQKTNIETMEKEEKSVLRHVVIFKFKDEASAEEVSKLNQQFNELPDHIAAIKDFEWGLNDSPENFHQGFTHCYMLTFDSEKDRDSIYTPHPKHQAFVANLQSSLEKVFVVDYWTK